MQSVANQTHTDYTVSIIDDASTDGTERLIQQFVVGRDNWYVHRNAVNQKCPRNIAEAGKRLPGDDKTEVIFLLDGDDFLPHDGVLSRVAGVFVDPSIWFTYGQYAPHPHNTGQTLATEYSPETVRSRAYRRDSSCFNHPLIFRRFLLEALGPADFQDEQGWFRCGYDQVLAIPMLEICTGFGGLTKNYKCLDDVLYIYNAVNPISDVAVIPTNEWDRISAFRKRPPKQPLEVLTVGHNIMDGSRYGPRVWAPPGSHLGGCVTADADFPHGDPGTYAPQVWQYLKNRFLVHSVLDVGCGEGHSLKWFLEHGVSGRGIEGLPGAIAASPVRHKIFWHDYQLGPYWQPLMREPRFDLIWSCEFVEHVDESFVDNFLADFARGEVIAMTHAVPGQGGWHHVNCQDSNYWIDRITKLGYQFELQATQESRDIDSTGYWGKTGLVFSRTP
jgi:glycosyltransferase involved in cell wall biosynthesis